MLAINLFQRIKLESIPTFRMAYGTYYFEFQRRKVVTHVCAGHKRPVVLVGNKVDLLPADSRNYLRTVQDSLLRTAREAGLGETNILHTALISARTGFGVESLIDTLFSSWGWKGTEHGTTSGINKIPSFFNGKINNPNPNPNPLNIFCLNSAQILCFY